MFELLSIHLIVLSILVLHYFDDLLDAQALALCWLLRLLLNTLLLWQDQELLDDAVLWLHRATAEALLWFLAQNLAELVLADQFLDVTCQVLSEVGKCNVI